MEGDKFTCKVDPNIAWIYVKGGIVPHSPTNIRDKPLVEYYYNYDRILDEEDDDEDSAVRPSELNHINALNTSSKNIHLEGIGNRVVTIKLLDDRIRMFDEDVDKDADLVFTAITSDDYRFLTTITEDNSLVSFLSTTDDYRLFPENHANFHYLILPKDESLAFISTAIDWKVAKIVKVYPEKDEMSIEEAEDLFGQEKVVAELI